MTMHSLDKGKIDAFWQRRTNIKDPKIASNFRDDGRLTYDLAWVKRFTQPGSKILDLGAGTCQLAQELLDVASEIIAVEKFEGFLDAAPNHPKLNKYQADALNYSTTVKFDIILLFGVINFFSATEEHELYKKCYDMLQEKGMLLVKNQCGIKQEMIVDTYSIALADHYHARYPQVDQQEMLLAQYFAVNRFDIYPQHLNNWEETHFYAFAAEKNSSK